MTRSQLAAVAALPLLLAACSVTIPVDISSQLPLAGPAGSYPVPAQLLDLSGEGELWDRRDKLDHVSVDEVVVRVLSTGTGHQATRLTVALNVAPAGMNPGYGQFVTLPVITVEPFTTDASASVPGSAELDALLLQALKSSSGILIGASVDFNGVTNAVVRLELKGSAVYSTGK